MTSLTPNEDAARASIAEVRAANEGDAPQTAVTRIVTHMAEQAMLVQAREYDLGTDTTEIVEAIVASLGSQVAALIVGCGGCPRRQFAGLLQAISRIAGEEIAQYQGQPDYSSITPVNSGYRA